MELIYRIVSLFNRVSVAYRRVHPEIKKNWLVLDVGGGDSPSPKASVFCDAAEKNTERLGNLKMDRPFVWASAEQLPFKDRIFDYSILSHVLEHLSEPNLALDELQRVSRAGYIETPGAFTEATIPYAFHFSRCVVDEGVLTITMKSKYDERLEHDIFLNAIRCWRELYRLNSKVSLTTFYWKDKFKYKINGKAFLGKPVDIMPEGTQIYNRFIRKVAYWWYKPRKKFVLEDILACPICRGVLGKDREALFCSSCGRKYNKFQGYYDFRIIKIT
ncbi:MAG: methyltransferase domain-containing protein [Candidatus Jorgensenbacteria bacterium]